MNSRRYLHQVKKTKPFWMDTNFLIWALPASGYLIALSFDAGYLDFYEVPFSFVELNLYSATFSSLYIIFILGICSSILYGVMSLKDGEHPFYPSLFNVNNALIALIVLILSFFSDDLPMVVALWTYGILTVIRLIDKFFDKSSGLSFSERLRQEEKTSDEKIKLKSIKTAADKLYKALDVGFTAAIILGCAFAIGDAIAKYQNWTIKGHENTVVIPRNNHVFIEKKYDPVTKILDPENRIIFASEEVISLVPIQGKLTLTTQTKADEKRKKEEEKRLEIEKNKIK